MKLSDLYRHPVTDTGFSPVYQAQQRDYSERYSIHAQNATRWRHTAFGCIAITFLAVAGLVYDDSLSKFVPYIVERDRLGDEVAIGLAERAATPDVRVIQTEILNWIYNVRSVSFDAITERHQVFAAYNHTNKSGPANGELNEWFTTNNPFKRAIESVVTVSKMSALPVDPHSWHTWRANWTEEVRTRTGELEGPPTPREVSITVSYSPPATETDFHKNPSGIYIDHFNWKN